ncbi:YkoP family protein [Paenibacillus apiarius]|uniref:YkoP family protein n=1 Tax=Paenibacillus apiarius TaxID=46240 RepID=UPI003B3BB681
MKIKMYLLSIWNILDPIYYSLSRLTYIDRATPNIFRVRLLCYKGRDITLTDGTCIKNNDLLVKIHLYNVRLLKEILPLNNPVKKGRIISRSVEQSLPGVCRYIQMHPKSNEIKGIIGVTMLHRGCRQLGFDVANIHNPLYRAFKWITLMPIHFLSVSKPVKTLRKQKPKYLVMSAEMLAKKYGCDY